MKSRGVSSNSVKDLNDIFSSSGVGDGISVPSLSKWKVTGLKSHHSPSTYSALGAFIVRVLPPLGQSSLMETSSSAVAASSITAPTFHVRPALTLWNTMLSACSISESLNRAALNCLAH